MDDFLDPMVASIAAYGLTTSRRLPRRSVDDASFDDVLVAARRHRVLGLLASAVADGAFPVTDEQRERCSAAEQDWAVQALHLERLLLDVTAVLERSRVDYRVFKGPALAHTVYPHAGWRIFADLDLLVRGTAFDRARDAIVADLGAVRRLPELVPGFDGEFGKDAPLTIGSMEVDLHRTFASGPVGFTIPLDELFDGAPTITLGGRALPTLTPTRAFLQVCINAAVGDVPVRACSLRDVVQLSRFVDDDVPGVVAMARAWRIGMLVQRSVHLAWSSLGLAPGPFADFASTYRPPAWERWSLRSYLGPARSYARPAAAVFAIRGVRPRVRYVRALVLPQRAYLQSRGLRRGSLARGAVDAVRPKRARDG